MRGTGKIPPSNPIIMAISNSRRERLRNGSVTFSCQNFANLLEHRLRYALGGEALVSVALPTSTAVGSMYSAIQMEGNRIFSLSLLPLSLA